MPRNATEHFTLKRNFPKMTKLEKLKKELAEVKDKYPTEHDNHDAYWRGVRRGLEVSIAVLKDKMYE
jgi:hypothetical protein